MEEAKKPKTDHDRLSSLSDDLLCHILTFLSIKEAYRTSVLSSRWISLCSKILDLQFELPLSSKANMSREIQHAYAVLLRRNENIRKLAFHSQLGCKPHVAQLWVLRAKQLKVKELDLDLILQKPTILPISLLMSTSLVILKLRGNIKTLFHSSIVVNFPSLKILHLELLFLYTSTNDGEYDLNYFLCGCPCLEEFLLQDCLIRPINISHHLLKRLCLNLFNPSYITDFGPLQLNVPSLEILDITDCTLRKYEFINLFNVHRATIRLSKPSDFDGLYKLLNGISNVKSLILTSDTIKFIL
ncbi:putative F-box/LRR-repeat protein At3g42770 [Cicer arietinum]|uniref:F-box/LRR-repeat protein At3g42770 n=1 Tax=Cicer arietinum TaxID=3827 RepID=A0A3Q7YB54_CICAR|nr:putative F-box/LRR-repeat protein At3g42770 [Cicer arietinum]